MAVRDRADDFFIGWLGRLPRAGLAAAAFTAAALVAGFGALAFGLGASVDDPGDGRFEWGLGPQAMAGLVETTPYPILRLPPSGAHPAGHAVLLAGGGKVGVQDRAAALDGRAAEARGFLLKRGDLDMLQVDTLAPAEAAAGTLSAAAASRVPLGRWRLVGEICDGKCYAGAMRPGTGLAHKACANLCLMGGLPPVFVATSPVEGSQFLLLAASGGGPLAIDAYRDLTALLVEVEGDVERVDDLLVLKTDLAAARVK
jgi:hypothetical protein